jgi:hypothetical protein
MVWTQASEAASSFACPQRHQAHDPFQDAQGTKSNPKVVMEDVGADDTAGSGSDSEGPVREASTTIDEEDEHLVYDRTCFKKDMIWHRFNLYYSNPRVIIERRVEVAEFNERARRVRAVLEAQGWTDMVEDHRPVMEEIVREFYMNFHQRRGLD